MVASVSERELGDAEVKAAEGERNLSFLARYSPLPFPDPFLSLHSLEPVPPSIDHPLLSSIFFLRPPALRPVVAPPWPPALRPVDVDPPRPPPLPSPADVPTRGRKCPRCTCGRRLGEKLKMLLIQMLKPHFSAKHIMRCLC